MTSMTRIQRTYDHRFANWSNQRETSNTQPDAAADALWKAYGRMGNTSGNTAHLDTGAGDYKRVELPFPDKDFEK